MMMAEGWAYKSENISHFCSIQSVKMAGKVAETEKKRFHYNRTAKRGMSEGKGIFSSARLFRVCFLSIQAFVQKCLLVPCEIAFRISTPIDSFVSSNGSHPFFKGFHILVPLS